VKKKSIEAKTARQLSWTRHSKVKKPCSAVLSQFLRTDHARCYGTETGSSKAQAHWGIRRR
jgi:hypothetical protein